MPTRYYNGRTLIFVIVAMIFLVVIDLVFFGPKKESPISAPQIIEVQKPDPVSLPPIVLGEQPKPDFAPAHDAINTDALMPKIEDLPTWQKNAVASTIPKDKPRLALIIDDMGLDVKHSHEAMDLHGPLTMSFMPYAKNLREQTSYAISKGHELMVHLPMQPENATLDAGPEVLKVEQTPEQFLKILDEDLKAFGGYVGVNNHMGSKMTQDRAGMMRLMAELKKRGLLFVDSKTIASSVGADEARKAGIPYAVRNIFVDDEESNKAIEGSLGHIEKLALSKGLVVAIAHPRAETIAALKDWLPTLKAKGIELIPVSAAVSAPQEATKP